MNGKEGGDTEPTATALPEGLSPEALAKADLVRAIKKQIAFVTRRALAVRRDLARLDEVEPLQKTGRLLLAQSSKIPRGASRATLVDWEAGGTIEVSLNPAQSVKSHAEALFAKARRYKRGEATMKKRLAETERTIADLELLASHVEAAPIEPAAIDALSARARSLGVPGLAAPPEAGRPRRARAVERLPYTVFHGSGGSPIFVGRGAKDNDELTTKVARPRDLWLHAKGFAGAHVVVPLSKGAVCPPELLVDAATLAAHFSDARGEAVCEVSYIDKRYVRKPRKSPPGLVMLDREKVIAVRLEPARLERLLATKEKPAV